MPNSNIFLHFFLQIVGNIGIRASVRCVATTILIVEDEEKLRNLERTYLEREGHTVLTAASGSAAIELVLTSDIDLAIVDLGLPDIDGEVVISELKSRQIPIIVLTARATEPDRVYGLELGADDYVTKPFSPRELVLRVHAVLRRNISLNNEDAPRSFGNNTLVIDEKRHMVFFRGQSIETTRTEWALLQAFTSSPGRVYSRLELVNRARGYDFNGYERVIDGHIKNLRKKLEDDPRKSSIIQTVVGVGYKFCLSKDAT